MGYFRELPNIAYQSPLNHKNSSQDYVIIKDNSDLTNFDSLILPSKETTAKNKIK